MRKRLTTLIAATTLAATLGLLSAGPPAQADTPARQSQRALAAGYPPGYNPFGCLMFRGGCNPRGV